MRAMPGPRPLVFVTLTALALGACDDPNAKTAPTASATAAETTSPPDKTAAPAPPPPKPLAVADMQKALKCGGVGHGPCEVLEQFAECAEWSPVTQSGDGRWLGKATVVKKGVFVDEVALLRTLRVPLSEVGPGQLPAKIGLTTIPDEDVTEKRQAEKAIRAYDRGDVPRPSNQVIDYIKNKKEWPEAFSMQAEDNQVYVAVEAGMYLCQKDNQRLLAIKLSNDRQHKGDGTYAMLHPVSW